MIHNPGSLNQMLGVSDLVFIGNVIHIQLNKKNGIDFETVVLMPFLEWMFE